MSFFQGPSDRERSMLPLIDSESLLPFESKKPTCPLPIQTPWGGGGASSALAFVIAATTRRDATTVLNTCMVKIAPFACGNVWPLTHERTVSHLQITELEAVSGQIWRLRTCWNV